VKKATRTVLLFVLICVFIALVQVDLDAQCAMCRAAPGSNLGAGGKTAHKLNTGILYMLSLPYLLVMTLGYIWYRNNKKVKNLEAEQSGDQAITTLLKEIEQEERLRE